MRDTRIETIALIVSEMPTDRPRLVSVTFVRNEADILETFARFHAEVFDRMILVNHRSTDASPEILRRLKAEGLPIEVEDETSVEFQLGRFMTSRFRAAVERNAADWVMPIDPDEFLVSRDGRPVRTVLAGYASSRVVKVPWRTYVPVPGFAPDSKNVLDRIQHHRAEEGDQFHKVLVPRELVLSPGAMLGVGGHTFVRQGRLVAGELPFTRSHDLVLAHLPLRSVEQLRTKVLLGWLAILSKSNRERTESFHSKELYARLLKCQDVTPEDLAEMAMSYSQKVRRKPAPADLVHNPLRPESGDISPRYEVSVSGDPLTILMQVAEEQAAALGEVRRQAVEGAVGLETLRGYVRRSRLADVARRVGLLKNAIGEVLGR